MKKTHIYFSMFLVMGALASCGDSSTTSTATTDSTTQAVTNPEGTVTTTTTVTKTYSGKFMPQPETKYMDLKTHKTVSVRIDTTRGELVSDETNEPIYLFVDPMEHDTIYGMTGNPVNNYIIHDNSGEMMVDTMRINADPQAYSMSMENHKTKSEHYKEKVTDNKVKIKTDDIKIKEKNGVIKKVKAE